MFEVINAMYSNKVILCEQITKYNRNINVISQFFIGAVVKEEVGNKISTGCPKKVGQSVNLKSV